VPVQMLPQTLGQHRPAKTDDMKMNADLEKYKTLSVNG
jgi:uncharacterized protein involved in high-affinity Fe2+ transport